MKLLRIRSEYIQKHTPEDNCEIESIQYSLKIDYIWVNDSETFQNIKKLIESAFNDYNIVKPNLSIDYLPPDEFEGKWNESADFRNKFLEERKKEEEKILKNRIEKKRSCCDTRL